MTSWWEYNIKKIYVKMEKTSEQLLRDHCAYDSALERHLFCSQ